MTLCSGDCKMLSVKVTDENNQPISLSGAEVKWVLAGQDGTILISKSVGNGVTIPDAAAGQFQVALQSSETKGLNGLYRYATRVTLPDGRSGIVLSGQITIVKDLI